MSKSIAIIIARGGSKRIPRKNIRNFLGRPIVEYSLKAALGSNCFNEVMVSTDDAEIADIARNAGASVPFLRSAENANDFATTADVIKEVLDNYSKTGKTFEYFCCIYPTAPFITAMRLSEAFGMLTSADADAVITITKFNYNIFRALRTENDNVSFYWPENMNKRSQDMPVAFHDCGQFYFLKTASFIQTPLMFQPKTMGLEIPEMEMQDIDTEEDWKIAEVKYQLLQNK